MKLAEQLAADKPDFNVAPYMDEIFKMDKEINDLANRILEFQERGYGLISTGQGGVSAAKVVSTGQGGVSAAKVVIVDDEEAGRA